MRPTRDETWLRVAAELAKRSTCLRRAVGCVLLDDLGQVLSTGYNGRARGLPHCHEKERVACVSYDFAAREVARLNAFGGDAHVTPTGGSAYVYHPHACVGATAATGTQLDACEAVHAEQNALLQCRDVRAVRTCYVTASPCVTCVKLLMQTGCTRIVFAERYAHDAAARALWHRHRGISADDTAFTPDWQHFPQR